MYNDSAKEIQMCLNCNRPVCDDCLSRGGHAPKHRGKGTISYDYDITERVAKLYIGGETLADLSAQFNMPKETVRWLVKKYRNYLRKAEA